jgi:putative pyruvate formate lyase activating enzyme
MKEGSRRQFLRSCLYFALSGLGSTFLPLFTGTGRANKGVSQPCATPQKKSGKQLEPAYLKLHHTGELRKRGQELWNLMEKCRLCPRECGVNRLEGDKGFCQASSMLEISACHPHFGEEKPLVGQGGSGTIFLTNCSLRCVFCINWEISQEGRGWNKNIEDAAQMMLALQKLGCHNINFVTPTHYSPHILLAIDKAVAKGLRIPIVYNTCGWERLEIISKLDGIVDIYLPDFKYFDKKMASRYSSGADTYPEITKAALLEMHRQVGIARPGSDGIMCKGLMIRHLVMPNSVSGTKQVINWIAENLPKDTYLNLMSQYRPVYKATEYPKISRRITREEYGEAVRWARAAGLTNLDTQGFPF